MTRTEIVQRLIDTTHATSYLEIGVEQGVNFLPIRCPLKVAVDPAFQIRPLERSELLNIVRKSKRRFYEVESDEYFRSHVKPDQRFDVAFVDGLHTFAQALNDLRNCLTVLAPGGCVALHDCSPPHAAAAYPANSLREAAAANVPGWNGEWCGDVWKTIRQVKDRSSGLETFVLDCDYGVGIVVKTDEDWSIDTDISDVDQLTYVDLDSNREEMINLKPAAYLDEFLARWKREH